jgi:hypothetical protein
MRGHVLGFKHALLTGTWLGNSPAPPPAAVKMPGGPEHDR